MEDGSQPHGEPEGTDAPLGVFGGHLIARLPAVRPERASDAWFYEQPVAMAMLGDLMLGRANRDDATLEAAHARVELERFAAAGGRVVVELTAPDEGRDVAMLKALAAETGVRIVGAAAVSADGAQRAVDDVSRGDAGLLLVRADDESLTGSEGTVIASATCPVVIRGAGAELVGAARRAQDAGVDPARIAVTNAVSLVREPEQLAALMQLGVFAVFDGLGRIPSVRTVVSDHEVAVAIAGLVGAGHGDQVLLGTGLDRKHAFTSFGGHGLRFVPAQFVPYLGMFGLGDQARRFVTANLHRFLEGETRA